MPSGGELFEPGMLWGFECVQWKAAAAAVENTRWKSQAARRYPTSLSPLPAAAGPREAPGVSRSAACVGAFLRRQDVKEGKKEKKKNLGFVKIENYNTFDTSPFAFSAFCTIDVKHSVEKREKNRVRGQQHTSSSPVTIISHGNVGAPIYMVSILGAWANFFNNNLLHVLACQLDTDQLPVC